MPLLRSHALEGKWKGTESDILKAVYLVCDEIKSIFSLYGQLKNTYLSTEFNGCFA